MITATNLTAGLDSVVWEDVRERINAKGYDLIADVLDKDTCDRLISLYDDSTLFRKTVSMERYRFGRGEYKYFRYPLDGLIHVIRERVYSSLVPIANEWMMKLKMPIEYPLSHDLFIKRCNDSGQEKPTVLLLKYGEGGFNTLHQDLYGDVFFPFQIVFFLNEPGVDYSGGEFVLTEQIPRAQSKAIVLSPPLGSMLIFTTNFRPIEGIRGFYRVSMKHGVSEIHHGRRHTLGIIFHDALS
jgi:uncharacterized protein